MRRFIVAFITALLLSPAIAQQTGSRILTTPEVPQPKDAASAEASAAPTTRRGICDRLEGDARKRCLQEQREPPGNRSPAGIESGPGSTGMGSGAGVGASGSGGGGPR